MRGNPAKGCLLMLGIAIAVWAIGAGLIVAVVQWWPK